jgi:hypothetical protein
MRQTHEAQIHKAQIQRAQIQRAQIQRARRRHAPADGRQEPLPVDPRDPDIVHAHQLVRRIRALARRARAGGRAATAYVPDSR